MKKTDDFSSCTGLTFIMRIKDNGHLLFLLKSIVLKWDYTLKGTVAKFVAR